MTAIYLPASPLRAGAQDRPREKLEADLLIVGGTESGWASAITAARLGVPSVVLVNDIEWLGGQFTAEAVCAIDENRGPDRKVPFPRSGLFRELVDRIEAFNQKKYGHPRPGNAWTARTTIRPAEAAGLFREMLEPYVRSGQVRVRSGFYPVAARLAEGQRLDSVRFAPTQGDAPGLEVAARLTIDASDWGDVVQAAGAAFEYGPDLKDQYGEPSAPTDRKRYPTTDMNPITWCLVIEEAGDAAEVKPVPPPPHYDERRYFLTTSVTKDDYAALKWPHRAHRPFNPPWSPQTGVFYQGARTVYSQRRLVDHYNLKLKGDPADVILLNWSVQDYPLDVLPPHVVAALEADEPGASRKNIVVMNRRQRQIVFDDARRHSLGMLHHLQTTVHARMADRSHSFRRFRLTDEFGTPDRLPPKPYIRESLRLKAMYMMREQDTRFGPGHFAGRMYYDGVGCWQFVYDFHPTGRAFVPGEPAGEAWEIYIKPGRSWGTQSLRALFPLRSLVPERIDGLIGGQKNLGYSSIVSSAVRLHDQCIALGQASSALAAVCLKHDAQPRAAASDPQLLGEVRGGLCARPGGGQPVALWPYRDLEPGHPAFIAANRLALRGVLRTGDSEPDFSPDWPVTRRDVARAVARAALSAGRFKQYAYATEAEKRHFGDVDLFDADYAAIQSLGGWGLLPKLRVFAPEAPATRGLLRGLFKALGWQTQGGPQADGERLTRGELALRLWAALEPLADHAIPRDERLFQQGHDADGDGLADRDDALPFDVDNDSLSDLLDPDSDNDGLADGLNLRLTDRRQFNFTGRGSAAVEGYVNDFGLKYDAERGFGWAEDISENHRRRGKDPDPARDTFLFTRGAARWRCDVPEGRYRVTVCIGDSGFDQPGQRVRVEGETVADDQHTAAGAFFERSVIVDVKDGQLTVDMGTENPKLNTCLNWLRLERVE